MGIKKDSRSFGSLARVIACATLAAALLSPEAFAKSKKDAAAKKDADNPYAFIEKTELANGQIFAKDMVDAPESHWSASAFSAANDLLALDDHLKFSGKLSDAQMADLSAALFKDLPVRKDSGDIRVVMVGGFFGERSPLIIIIDNVSLIEGKVPGHSFAYRYLTNAMKFMLQDTKTGEESLSGTGLYINASVNYIRVAVPCDDGNLVLTNNLSIAPISLNAAKDDTELGNDMDTVIKDEFADNDGQALEIYKKLSAKKNLDPGVKLLVELNYYLYLLKINDLQKAEKALAGLTPILGDDQDKTRVAAVKVEAPFLLKTIKAYEGATIPFAQ